MANRFQNRSDSSANWTSANPILGQGEMGFEIDTQKTKMGDGSTAWNSLLYWHGKGQTLPINTTGGTTVLSEAQGMVTNIKVTGTPISPVIIQVPLNMSSFIAENAQGASAYSLTFQTATQVVTAPTVSVGTHTVLYSDDIDCEHTVTAGAGSGDMILASDQTVTGLKIFNDAKLGLRNVADTFTGLFTNAITAARTWTLPNVSGTIALTSDITGTNSGTNTGDQTGATITVTTRNIGNSTNLDTFLSNIDASLTATTQTGFQAWTGSGNYYSLASPNLTLLRGGSGFIKGKRITWVGSQVVGLTNHSAHWLYINSAGTFAVTTTRTEALYQDNILLFEAHYNGTDIEVVIENHGYDHNTADGHLLHLQFGTTLIPVDGTNVIGSDITRVATGTGGAVGDRQIKLVGASLINDQGLETSIPDSAGAAITYKFYYKNGSGQWTEYVSQTQFPMVYNAAGTITALTTSGATDTGLFTLYAVKAEPNSGLPVYIAVIDDAVYGTDAAALAVISAGTNEIADGTLFQALEPAQLGYVIVTNNGTSGYISTVQISKSTARSQTSGGSGASTASGVATNTANFTGYLSSSDTNVQVALDSLDKIGRLATPIASATTTDLSTATGNYVHITGSVTITGFGTVVAGNLRHLVFDGAPLLTHNATSLILPGAVNIQAVAGDSMILRSEGSGNWKCVTYQPYTGTGTGAFVRATSPQISVIELGHATDTTLSRVSAGVIAVEGVNVMTVSSTDTITGVKTFNDTKLSLRNVADTFSGVFTNTITAARTWTLPDISSTIAVLGLLQTWTAPQRGTVTALTSTSASIAIDLAVTNNFSHTFTENTALANPSNPVVGQAGVIIFTQHASAAKTLSYGSQWKEETNGTAPSVSVTVGAINELHYRVVSATEIRYVLGKAGIA